MSAWPAAVVLALVPWMLVQDPRSPERVTRLWRHWSRDRWVWLLCAAGLASAVSTEPMFLPIGCSILLRWGGWRAAEHVVTWASIIAVWFLARALPAAWHAPIVLTWLAAAACAASMIVLHGCLRLAVRQHRQLPAWLEVIARTNWYSAWFGQRTLSAAYLALMLPLAAGRPDGRWLVLLLVVGLVLTASWASWLAAMAASVVLWPWTAIWLGALVALAVVDVGLSYQRRHYPETAWTTWRHGLLERLTVRGDTLATIGIRLRCWYGLARIWRSVWLTGAGLDTSRRWSTAGVAGHPTWAPLVGAAHNDAVELVFEHGLLGVLAIGAFAWRVGGSLHWGDPTSGAVVAGAVLVLATFMAQLPQVGVPWLVVCAWVAR